MDDSQHHSCGKVGRQSHTRAACIKALQAPLCCKLIGGAKSANALHDILDGCFAPGK